MTLSSGNLDGLAVAVHPRLEDSWLMVDPAIDDGGHGGSLLYRGDRHALTEGHLVTGVIGHRGGRNRAGGLPRQLDSGGLAQVEGLEVLREGGLVGLPGEQGGADVG